MIVLALDLAKQTGWCAGAPGTTPRYGSFSLAGESNERFGVLYNRLCYLIRDTSATMMMFEAPITSGSKTNTSGSTLRYLYGYVAVAEAAAQNSGIPVRECAIATWRKHFLGNGGMNRKDAKRAAITRCRQMGYSVETDDEADAIGIWDYAVSLKSPEHACSSTDLFMGR